MKTLLFFLGVIGLASCAATRTKYEPHGERGGFSEKRVNEKLLVARFVANALTSANDAALFSQFRAIEICRDQGFRTTRIHGVEDQSTQQKVQRTSNFNYTSPTYFSGNSGSKTNYNIYGKGFGSAQTNTSTAGSIYGGNQFGNSLTWEETLNYPTFDTYFTCTDLVFRAKVEIRTISADDMKPFVKDLMGAVQIQSLDQDSPNQGILKIGDFIIKVNDDRVQNTLQFASSIDGAKDKSKILIRLIRDGKSITVTAKAVDDTSFFAQATEQITVSACTVPEIKKRPLCQKRIPAGEKQDNTIDTKSPFLQE